MEDQREPDWTDRFGGTATMAMVAAIHEGWHQHHPGISCVWPDVARELMPISHVAHEPPPIRNSELPTWDLVIRDIYERDTAGRRKYGTPHQAFNGRNALVDAYQEALDQVCYLRAAIREQEEVGWEPVIKITKTQLAAALTGNEAMDITTLVESIWKELGGR